MNIDEHPNAAPFAPLHRFILVHGTFASDDGNEWWQANSVIRRWLDQRLAGLGQCEPSPVFRWSGENNERDRDGAAHRLLDELRQLDGRGIPYHLIGHSHGGSVIVRALELSLSSPLRRLRTWTTFGTPFLHLVIDRGRFWLALPLLLALLLFAGIIIPSAFDIRLVMRDLIETLPWHVVATFGTILCIATLFLLMLLLLAARLLKDCWTVYRRHKQRKEAWRLYGNRWIPIWSSADEAINGLRGSVSLNVPITGYSAANDFIWSRIRGFLQGTHETTLVIGNVTNTPIGDIAHCPLLSESLDAKLQRDADDLTATQAKSFRPVLSQASLEKDPANTLLTTLGCKVDLTMLVHCRYMNDLDVFEIIARAIEADSGQSSENYPPWMPILSDTETPMTTRRASRFQVATAITMSVAILSLELFHMATWPLLEPFTHRRIVADSIGVVTRSLPIIATDSLRSRVANEWISALVSTHRFETAHDFVGTIANPRLRLESLRQVAAALAVDGNATKASAAYRQLADGIVSSQSRDRRDQPSAWFEIELDALTGILNCDPQAYVKDPYPKIESLVDIAIEDATRDRDNALYRMVLMAGRLRLSAEPDVLAKITARAAALINPSLKDFEYASVGMLADLAIDTKQLSTAHVATEALCNYVDSHADSKPHWHANRVVGLLNRLGDARKDKYARLASEWTSGSPNGSPDEAEISRLLETKRFREAFAKASKIPDVWNRIYWMNQVGNKVARFPQFAFQRIINPTTGFVSTTPQQLSGQLTAENPHADCTLYLEICRRSIECTLSMSESEKRFGIPVRQNGLLSLMQRDLACAESLPVWRLRLWEMACWFGDTDALRQSACELVALAIVDQPLASILDRFAKLENEQDALLLQEWQKAEPRQKKELESIRKDRQLKAAIFKTSLRKSQSDDWNDAIGLLADLPQQTGQDIQLVDRADSLTTGVSLRLFCAGIIGNAKAIQSYLTVTNKIAEPNLRMMAKATLAQQAARAEDKELAAVLCHEVLEDAELGAIRNMSDRLAEVATALALSSRFRQAIAHVRYLEPWDRVDLMRTIVESIDANR